MKNKSDLLTLAIQGFYLSKNYSSKKLPLHLVEEGIKINKLYADYINLLINDKKGE